MELTNGRFTSYDRVHLGDEYTIYKCVEQEKTTVTIPRHVIKPHSQYVWQFLDTTDVLSKTISYEVKQYRSLIFALTVKALFTLLFQSFPN